MPLDPAKPEAYRLFDADNTSKDSLYSSNNWFSGIEFSDENTSFQTFVIGCIRSSWSSRTDAWVNDIDIMFSFGMECMNKFRKAMETVVIVGEIKKG